ncbi:MAG: hypothetical protein QM680_00120 [Luteolibacter sp.]
MKLLIPWLMFFSVCAAMPSAEDAGKAWEQRPELDEISWKDPLRGSTFKARIISASLTEVVVEKQVGGQMTRRAIPLADLGEIRCFPLSWEYSRNIRPLDAAALEVLWKLREPLLGKASGVSECGVSLAKTWRKSGDPALWAKAEEILKSISRRETQAVPKEQAAREIKALGFVRLLLSGKPEEKEQRAWEITETSMDDRELMLLATDFLADLHFQRLAALQEEHPKWMEDDEIEELRNKIYHMAIDLALYPSLFAGDRDFEASEGLAKVARVHQLCEETEPLEAVVGDLAELYPDTAAAKRLSAMRSKPVTEVLPTEKPMPQEKPVPAVPEAAIRYNLFKD